MHNTALATDDCLSPKFNGIVRVRTSVKSCIPKSEVERQMKAYSGNYDKINDVACNMGSERRIAPNREK